MQGSVVNLGGGDDLFFYKSQNNKGKFALTHISRRRPPWSEGVWQVSKDGVEITAKYKYGRGYVHTRGFRFRGATIVWSDGTISQLVEDFTDITSVVNSLLIFKREMLDDKLSAVMCSTAAAFGVGKMQPLAHTTMRHSAGHKIPEGFNKDFVISMIDDALDRLGEEFE